MKYTMLLLLIILLVQCTAPTPATMQVFETITLPTPSAVPVTATNAQPTAVSVATSTPVPTFQPSPTMVQPWRFVVLGDTRTSGLDPPAEMGMLVEQARVYQPELTLVVGDLINAMDDPFKVQEQWRRWHLAINPLGETSPARPWLLVTPGNHDVQNNAWATDRMVEAFPELPSNGPAGLQRLAYSYDYRGVRFISLHSEQYGDPHRLGDTQWAWLEAQLANNPNRYTIIFSHDPAFPVGPHIGSALDVYPNERDQLWELLKQYHGTAYIAGHEHLYNRQDIDGVTQLIVGASGSYPYAGYGGDYYHYLVAEVTDQELRMQVYDINGTQRDSFVLRSQQP